MTLLLVQLEDVASDGGTDKTASLSPLLPRLGINGGMGTSILTRLPQVSDEAAPYRRQPLVKGEKRIASTPFL